MTKPRELNFRFPADAMAEAERLAKTPTRTLGRFTHGQILEHLARTFDVASGHAAGPAVPWFMRAMGRLIRGSLISKPMKPGFKLPGKAQSYFWPDHDVPVDHAMQHLRDAYERYQSTDPIPPHPFFGRMDRAQLDQLTCRHMALHLGFIDTVA